MRRRSDQFARARSDRPYQPWHPLGDPTSLSRFYAFLSPSSLSFFPSLLFWRPLIPFLLPAATTLPSAERYPARGPCPREFMDEYRGEVISLSASRSSRMAGDTQVLRLRSCAVRAGVRRCSCASARGVFRWADAQDVRASTCVY